MTAAEHPSPHPCPVPFIVGTGRCGTTLLRLMLDAHPALAVPPETHFIPEVVQTCRQHPEPAEAFLQAVTGHRTWPDFHLSPEPLRSRILALRPFSLGQALREFYRSYAARFGKERWGDKTPVYAAHMRQIHHHLPEARFIHLVRDGRDVALSVKSVWFGPKEIREAADWWATGIREARYQAQFLPHYLEVRYEDLVTDPVATLRSVCQFLDLPWDPALLDYYRGSEERLAELGAIATAKGRTFISTQDRKDIHKLTSQPPQSQRVARWKTEMSEADQLTFEAIAGDILAQYGYPVSGHVQPSAPAPLWIEQRDRLQTELAQVIEPNQSFLLLDENQLGWLDFGGQQRPVPFTCREGEYWGPPADDRTAIAELEQRRQEGVTHAALAWPSFWWLDHYPAFFAYLRAHFHQVYRSERLMVYDLRRDQQPQPS